MKSRLIIMFIVVIALTLAGCRSIGSTVTPAPDPAAGTQAPVAVEASPSMAPSQVKITFEKHTDGEAEWAQVKAEQDSATVWTYDTQRYAMTELERVQWIAQLPDRAYFVEGGTVVALDSISGEELWRNEEFGGSSISYAFDEHGHLFLSGYYGPDFMEIDFSGNTIKRIEDLTEDYIWPYEMAYEGGMVKIRFDGPQEAWLVVRLEDYSVTVEDQ